MSIRKNTFIGLATATTILQGCTSKETKEHQKTIAQKQLIDSFLQQEKHTDIPDAVMKASHFTNDSSLQTALIDTLLHTENTATTTYTIKQLMREKDPAITVADSRRLEYMLGTLDTRSIIEQYNPTLFASKPKDYDWKWHDIRQLDSLVVPHVFPSMKGFFTTSLEDFLTDKPRIKKMVGSYKTIIIVTDLPNGRLGLGYYKNGYLTHAHPISIGDARWHTDKQTGKKFHAKITQGHYIIQRKESTKKSKSNDAMAYFLEVFPDRGLGLHGQITRSKRESHGCTREPQLGAKSLFSQVTSGTDALLNPPHTAKTQHATHIVFSRTPSIREVDSTQYFSKKPQKQREARNTRKEHVLSDTAGFSIHDPFIIDTNIHKKTTL